MSDIVKTLTVTCPYCNAQNRYIIGNEGKALVTCGPEPGELGCKHDFVIDVRFTIEAEVFALEPANDNEFRCWYCFSVRPSNDDGPCPCCDKPIDPSFLPANPWNVCPNCESRRVYPASSNPRNMICARCKLDYYPEKYETTTTDEIIPF